MAAVATHSSVRCGATVAEAETSWVSLTRGRTAFAVRCPEKILKIPRTWCERQSIKEESQSEKKAYQYVRYMTEDGCTVVHRDDGIRGSVSAPFDMVAQGTGRNGGSGTSVVREAAWRLA